MDEQKKTSGSLALNSTPRVITIAPSTPVRDRKLRVAAYARVSSRSEDQLNSFAAQNAHYTELITDNPEWEFVDVYADKGITGTSAEKRDDFQRLLADCRNGQIDMIIVKSLSRFARNTVTLLETVRELKALDVDVFFEEQNIHSMNGDGELMLSILASFAQEESRSVSENCKWRIRNDFQRGKPSFFRIYGYKMKSGRLEIVSEEAAIVRMIFRDYLDGMGCELISKKLNEMKISPMTSDQWWPSAKPDWHFVQVYADKGITGTSTKHREHFNEMIADALAGKIDLIITKSVSHFARNTVDSLTTIRLLKEHGVEVYFEEQNICTLDSKGELLLTIMSSLAQEESRSISENVTWGQRKRFAERRDLRGSTAGTGTSKKAEPPA